MRNALTRGQLEDWIAKGLANIEGLPDRNEPILIYGCGVLGRDLYQILSARGIRVRGFVDKMRAGEISADSGTAILAPEAITDGQWLVQSINNPQFPLREINRDLAQRGARLLNPLQAMWWCGGRLLWMDRPDIYVNDLDRIVRIGQRLERDDRARYAGVWRDRLTGEFETLYDTAPSPYFPPDLPAIPSELNLVDCGAFDGDVARQAVAAGRRVRWLAAFEPDPENFDKLKAWLAHGPDGMKAIALPAAVGNENRILSFAGGHASSSRLDPNGRSQVPCVRLDDVLFRFPINYLKLDVEGAEADALRGAANIIRRRRPHLAVSIYHRPRDLFELPQLIDELSPGYRYHLRLHATAGIDSVLYAIPLPHGH